MHIPRLLFLLLVAGIVVTVVLAFAAGAVGGFIIRATGEKVQAYQDADEFADAEPLPVCEDCALFIPAGVVAEEGAA